MSLTQEAALAVLARFTYKAGWGLFGTTQGAQGLIVHVQTPKFPSADVDYGKTQLTFTQSVNLDACDSEAAFVNVVRHYVLLVEEHEANEWLKLDGARLFPPHARLARID